MIDSDFLIIGGGIAGLSLAATLSARGRVVLIDKEPQLFFHTSGRSAQQSQPTYGPASIRRFTSATLRLIDELDVPGGPLVTPRPLVWVDLVGQAPQLDRLLGEIPGLERIARQEAVDRFPALRPEVLAGAALDPASVEVALYRLKDHLVAQLEAAGAIIALGQEALDARRDDGRWTVTTNADAFRAPVVVVAAGPWADATGRLFGAIEPGLVPARRTVVVAAVHGQAVDPQAPMLMDANASFYFRPSGSEILASSLEDEPSVPEDAQPRQDTIERTFAVVNRTTLLEIGSPYRSWTGLRTLSGDGLPVIGWDDRVEGLYWLAGQGGYGIQTSLGLASAVADVLVGDEASLDEQTAADLAAFDPARLAR